MILKSPAGSGQNVYNEYMYINGAWELIGDTAVDLTGYATETYVTNAIKDKADKATTLAGYGITDAASDQELAAAKTELQGNIDAKADATAVTALESTVATKANQADLDTLENTVNGLVSSQITY